MPRYKVVDTTYCMNLKGTWETVNKNEFVFPTKEDAEVYFRMTKYELMDAYADIDKFFKIKNTKDRFDLVLEKSYMREKMICLDLLELKEN